MYDLKRNCMSNDPLIQTVIAPQTAVLAVVLNENILKKAQEEIDRVVGNYRLPTLADRKQLPYLEGIIREALRCAFQAFSV